MAAATWNLWQSAFVISTVVKAPLNRCQVLQQCSPLILEQTKGQVLIPTGFDFSSHVNVVELVRSRQGWGGFWRHLSWAYSVTNLSLMFVLRSGIVKLYMQPSQTERGENTVADVAAGVVSAILTYPFQTIMTRDMCCLEKSKDNEILFSNQFKHRLINHCKVLKAGNVAGAVKGVISDVKKSKLWNGFFASTLYSILSRWLYFLIREKIGSETLGILVSLGTALFVDALMHPLDVARKRLQLKNNISRKSKQIENGSGLGKFVRKAKEMITNIYSDFGFSIIFDMYKNEGGFRALYNGYTWTVGSHILGSLILYEYQQLCSYLKIKR
eukprot:g2560.t1